MTGGTGGDGAVATAELYHFGREIFVPVGPMTSARIFHTATRLGANRVLITGGGTATGFQASAEIFAFGRRD